MHIGNVAFIVSIIYLNPSTFLSFQVLMRKAEVEKLISVLSLDCWQKAEGLQETSAAGALLHFLLLFHALMRLVLYLIFYEGKTYIGTVSKRGLFFFTVPALSPL